MKDHEKRELVDRLTKLAQEFADTQQLRARIAGEVLPALAAVQAGERERICAEIKAADDKASGGDYMLDSDDCIKVARGQWVWEE